MREHTFIGDFDFSLKNFSLIEPGLIHKIVRVLRLGKNDTLFLNDGKKKLARVRITDLDKKHIDVEILEVHENGSEPPVAVFLYAALIKKERFEWLIEKSVEAGAREIIPLRTQYALKISPHVERLNKIAKEAAEQSGRGVLPVVRDPVFLKDALRGLSRDGGIAVFHTSEGKGLDGFIQWKRDKNQIFIFIGPEGGWHEEEVKLFREQNSAFFTFGALTLRSETAGTIATFIASAFFPQ